MTDLSKIFTFKAAIFDLDGTLIDSEPVHLLAWQEACKKYGLPEMTWEYLLSVGGISTVNICRMMCRENGLDLDCEKIAAEKTNLYRTKYMERVPLLDGIADILKECAQKGMKIAVATGSQQPETRHLLEKFGLIDLVEAIVSSDQVPNCKPAPDTYLIAAQRLGVDPADCIVFEDTLVGLQGVKAAKMTALRVKEGRVISDYQLP